MARIAIDMTCTPRNKTGIGRYIKNLVEALQKEDSSTNTFFLRTVMIWMVLKSPHPIFTLYQSTVAFFEKRIFASYGSSLYSPSD